MSEVDYIKAFAEYFVMLINMIKEFFAGFGSSSTTPTEAASDNA